ncbi:uncharacterized protein EAF01_003609 [Botrytis porri]|uniref:uncharacterized protein n=1 Tax=Botrytis porri TaxID=87229 RepID=UPI0019021927|nr:uncharacterized protein EAF01_003609 [Botrytis porri]KAF7909891.1 hypothetical protein EAF01_003609 [Botrytis porri]
MSEALDLVRVPAAKTAIGSEDRMQRQLRNLHFRVNTKQVFGTDRNFKRRIRGVKCDGAKPGCQRCKKFGCMCDGYDERKSFSFQPPTNPRRVFPRTETKQSSQRILVPKSLPFSFRITLLGEQEAIYSQIFQCETINCLADGRKSPLWYEIVRHACLEEPSIFHCAIAIAALDRACKFRSSNSSSDVDFHHRHALQQYEKALKELQKASLVFALPSPPLTSPLLMFSFQIFHGDVRLAMRNVRTTIDLMYNWISSQTDTTTHIDFSPAPHILEHEVVGPFARLDAHPANACITWVILTRPSSSILFE